MPRARGFTPFLRQPPPFRRLPRSAIPYRSVAAGKTIVFDFNPPGTPEGYIAVAQPLTLGSAVLGAIVVASPKARLHNALITLLWRLLVGFAIAVVIAGLFAVYVTRRITNPVLALSRAADEVARGNYATPAVTAGGEIGHLSQRFEEMTAKLAEAEQLERHFLMTVSHELRTPLTAIRGHVAALREGVITDEAARAQSLEVVAQETARLERLVGDVLDLAKLEAKRFTLLREEVDMERLVDRAYATFGEEARRRGIDYERELDGQPGDRRRRRPGAPDHLEPARERVPLDARRRPDRPRAAAGERHGARGGRGHRARASRRRSGSGSSGRSGRTTTAAPGSAWRSRASSRSPTAAGSSSTASPGRGSRFELVLPATQPDG